MSIKSGATEEEVNPHEAVAGAQVARKPFLPKWCYHPQSAADWSTLLAALTAIGIPLWFWLAHVWNDQYVPLTPWVWSVPWILAFIYLSVQLFFLCDSLGRSAEELGMADLLITTLSAASALVTVVVVLMLWLFDSYNLGAFQWHELFAALAATSVEAALTAWMRFIVNRRYFSTIRNT